MKRILVCAIAVSVIGVMMSCGDETPIDLGSCEECSDPSGLDGPCTKSADCADGLECESDICKASYGKLCVNNIDCVGYIAPYEGNTCIFGTCSLVSAGVSCDDSHDCPPSSFCMPPYCGH